MQILVVDDDADLRQFLCHALGTAGWGVQAVATSSEAVERVRQDDAPDLVLLDVGLPDTDGWNTLMEIRAQSDVPVIMLTARSSRLDVVRGLELGADDYVAKPFEFVELRARIEAVIRRGRGGCLRERAVPAEPSPGLIVDSDRRTVRYRGKRVGLSPKEFEVLGVLASRPGHVFSSKEILDRAWDDSRYASTEDVTKCIYLIRRRFEADVKSPAPIVNERGFGYRLGDDASDTGSAPKHPGEDG